MLYTVVRSDDEQVVDYSDRLVHVAPFLLTPQVSSLSLSLSLTVSDIIIAIVIVIIVLCAESEAAMQHLLYMSQSFIVPFTMGKCGAHKIHHVALPLFKPIVYIVFK